MARLAIRCAVTVRDAIAELGSPAHRLHSGECERVEGGLRGVAVHLGARIGVCTGAGGRVEHGWNLVADRGSPSKMPR